MLKSCYLQLEEEQLLFRCLDRGVLKRASTVVSSYVRKTAFKFLYIQGIEEIFISWLIIRLTINISVVSMIHIQTCLKYLSKLRKRTVLFE